MLYHICFTATKQDGNKTGMRRWHDTNISNISNIWIIWIISIHNAIYTANSIGNLDTCQTAISWRWGRASY